MSIDNDLLEEDTNPNFEQEAKNMGWLPQEQFKGDVEHWVDAETFVEKGRHVMPILLQNNKRLQTELLTRDKKIDSLEQRLNNSTVAIEKLDKHYTEANKRLADEAKQNLLASLRAAREDNDTDAEQKILGELDDIRHSEKQPLKKVVPTIEEAVKEVLSPEFLLWQEENPWYGQDKKKTKDYLRIAEDLREDGNTDGGVKFFDAVTSEYDRRNAPEPTIRASKVEGGNNGSGLRGEKSYASLPAEAKQACIEDADDLVGPDNRFKSLKDWQEAYAKIYYG